jgi:phospholipase/lecithinase/hemolysin
MLKVSVILAALSAPLAAHAASPYAPNGSLAIPRLIAFGDSYTSVNTAVGYWKWSTQLLHDTNQVVDLRDVAVGGSTGGYYGSATNDYFGAAVGRWLAANAPGASDRTAVYFGYNDMTRSVLLAKPPTIAKILNDYHTALNRLITAGYATGNRHILLVMGHDWSKVPRFATGDLKAKAPAVHANMLTWNAGVAAIAAQHPNVVAADVFEPMECVFKHPSWFGFTDVSHELLDRNKAEQFLYNYKDRYHFGAHGHRLIRQVITYYLTTGWDWSNTTKTPSLAKARLVSDLAAGIVFPGVSCN